MGLLQGLWSEARVDLGGKWRPQISMTTMRGSKKGWVRSRGFADARTLHLVEVAQGETRCRNSVIEVLESIRWKGAPIRLSVLHDSSLTGVISTSGRGCTPRIPFQRPGSGDSSTSAPHWSRLAIRLYLRILDQASSSRGHQDGSAYD